MRTTERLTVGSNRSLCSLGRAKARPLTKRYAKQLISNKYQHLWKACRNLVYATRLELE